MEADIPLVEVMLVMILPMVLVVAHISMMDAVVTTLVTLVMMRLAEIEMLHIAIHLIYTE
jgi:hypothetical protein